MAQHSGGCMSPSFIGFHCMSHASPPQPRDTNAPDAPTAGFEDHVSYGCADYRRTVATVLTQIDRDPALLTDDRRVEVDLVHV